MLFLLSQYALSLVTVTAMDKIAAAAGTLSRRITLAVDRLILTVEPLLLHEDRHVTHIAHGAGAHA
jgi:hypothetical protein